MGLSGTVSMLETTSGFGEIESTKIPRPFSSQTVPHSTWKVLVTSDSHFRPNRKWKYGGNQKNELAAIDFLFNFNTMYGSMGHRFDARNYFRSRRNRNCKVATLTLVC